MLQLLSATPSPFARKIRIALYEKGIDFELLTEVPWNRNARAASLNPLGKVPVLICGDGSVFYESSYIFEYLELTYPEHKLLPADIPTRLEHRRWEVLSDGLCDALVLALIEQTRDAERRSELWIDRQLSKVDRSLAEMNRLHSPDTPFVVADRFGLADISLGCALDYIDVRFPMIGWRDNFPALVERLESLSTRESFALTIPIPQILADPVT